MFKTPVLLTNDYTIYFENILYNNIQDVLAVHCDVFKWNKTVRNSLKLDSFKLFIQQTKPIIALLNKSDKKHMKFLSLMGFIPYIDEVTIADGSKSMLFIWGIL